MFSVKLSKNGIFEQTYFGGLKQSEIRKKELIKSSARHKDCIRNANINTLFRRIYIFRIQNKSQIFMIAKDHSMGHLHISRVLYLAVFLSHFNRGSRSSFPLP